MSRITTPGQPVGAVLLLLVLVSAPCEAQRVFRFGGLGSVFKSEDSGNQTAVGYGAQIAYLSGRADEVALVVTRWPSARFGSVSDGATALSLESNWYPLDASALAPYVITGLGGFRYVRSASLLSPAKTEWGVSYLTGFGVRATVLPSLAVTVEGRIRSDDAIRNLEYRAGASYGFGALRVTRTRPGTIQPFVAALRRLGGGPYDPASPLAGLRLRRDRSRSQSIAVDLGIVGLRPQPDALSGQAAKTTSYLMMPSYEFSLVPRWGRPYLGLGPMLAGFTEGPDAGIRFGIQGGGGFDLYAGSRVEVNLSSRALWFQSASGKSQFGLIVGIGLGPRLNPGRAEMPEPAKDEP